jgi:DNA gyrase/topoisomerase IV subunit B
MSKTIKLDNTKSEAEKYDKKTPREHVLLRPDTYVGDIEPTSEDMWVYSVDDNRMVKQKITYTPGFLKIFDEVLVNSRDAAVNDPTCDTIKVEYNVEEGFISVWNNGDVGIPVEEHPVHKMLVPTMIFGELLTSSNYNDNEQRTTGGRNGLGSKLASIFATRFIVEIDDAKRNKRFKQEWSDNMLNVGKAEITKLPAKTKSSVKITFYPDFKRFGIKNLKNDHQVLFYRRTIDIAGTSNNKLKVWFNEQKVEVNNFKSYIEMYYSPIGVPGTDSELYFDNTNERWTVGILYKPDLGGEVVSFVNSINTYRGGTHCTHVIDNIIKSLINDFIKKKDKDIKVTPVLLKENLVFFINSIIINPAFSSQTKDTLTSKIDKFGSKYEPTPIFMKKLAKCGIVEQVIELAKFKENAGLKKTDGKKQIKISGIPKLEDANKAGTKESGKCTLILTEGDSAKATAMAGLAVLGRDHWGVFPLKGKLLNVREAGTAQLLANEEIKNLKLIMGLKQSEDYTSDEKFNTLRYGHVLLLTDQDTDGSHIKGLFINMLHTLWPSLVKRENFIQSLNTPIVKAIKGKDVITFYNLTDYDNWKESGETSGYKVKYYKGLGTSTSQEAKEYFIDIDTKLINYFWEKVKAEFSDEEKPEADSDDDSDEDSDEEPDPNIFIPVHDDDDAIRLAFAKERADDRKKWLMAYDKNNVLKYEQKVIPYYNFIHQELIHFSNDDLIRSIPSVIDGLKPSQRKILYGAFLRGLDKDEVKVAQLAGFVSDKAAYHHGEASLMGAIIGMAQDFVGSNNINILMPNGQFGCLAPDTPVLMWDGSIKRADNIVIGDKLVGDDGNVRNVSKTTSGNDNMFEITTEYGQKYTVNSEHIITLYYKNNNIIKEKVSDEEYYLDYFDGQTIKTIVVKYNQNVSGDDHYNKTKLSKEEAYNEILEKQKEIIIKYNISNKIDIKISDYMKLSKFAKRGLFMISNDHVVNWEKQQVKINPYILGTWLGDSEILTEFVIWAETIECELTHHKTGINSIGDKNHSSKTCKGCTTSNPIKHLLKEYIFNDKQTRLELLAGFIDTDGIVKTKGAQSYIEISQTKISNSNLISELEFLCKTLGFSTSIKEQHIGVTEKGNDIILLTLRIMGEFLHEIPTRLPKKKVNDSRHKRTFTYNNYMNFKINYIGKGPFYGWSLDGNERFLLGNFIVTHNSRLKGGSDSASPRYIWTKLEDLTPIIFNPMDSPILNQQDDDGMPIEPEFYAPIIPMILVNGAQGIGTGFSTKVPPYNPSEIITNLKNIIKGKSFNQMDPWWTGFEGIVSKIDDFNYEIYGTWSQDDNKLTITELPVGEWTSNYKEYLEKLLEDVPIRGKPDDKKAKKQPKKENPFITYKDNNTDTRVHFELTFEDGYLDTAKDIDKQLHLYKKYSIANMHLYGPEGHIKRYDSVEDIMRDYYKVRLGMYQKRKEYHLGILEHQLKVISFKVKFILMVVEKKLEINNKKKQEIEEKLEILKFRKLGRTKDDTKLSYDYLLSMPIYNLTQEKIEELKHQHDEKETEYNELNEKTPQDIWLGELGELEVRYEKWFQKKVEQAKETIGKKKSKKSKK